MHRSVLLAKLSFVAVICFALRSPAQQPAAPASAASQPVQLVPLVVVQGKHPAEVDLLVDIDSTGKVVHSSLASGDPKLYKAAAKAISTFLYRDHTGVTGAKAHVSFMTAKDLHNPTPDYPPIARAAHVAGTVELAGAIQPDGHVTEIAVLSGPPMLRESSVDALKKWVFPASQPSGSAALPRVLVFFDYDIW